LVGMEMLRRRITDAKCKSLAPTGNYVLIISEYYTK
jgi:hypothetical protein